MKTQLNVALPVTVSVDSTIFVCGESRVEKYRYTVLFFGSAVTFSREGAYTTEKAAMTAGTKSAREWAQTARKIAAVDSAA